MVCGEAPNFQGWVKMPPEFLHALGGVFIKIYNQIKVLHFMSCQNSTLSDEQSHSLEKINGINKQYIIFVSLLILILPAAFTKVDNFNQHSTINLEFWENGLCSRL
jgi:hypothetical protein